MVGRWPLVIPPSTLDRPLCYVHVCRTKYCADGITVGKVANLSGNGAKLGTCCAEGTTVGIDPAIYFLHFGSITTEIAQKIAEK
jgi:hypothetical protein